MLQHLHIQHLAIIAQADLYFKKGMTVITGETGAGKSIILNALHFILGHRADCDMIQPGKEKADITATFDVSHLPGAVLWLADLDLSHEEPNLCILRRTIYQNGRSRSYINGIPCTSQQLKMLGEYLIQLHGQNKHQLLLQPREQLRILDIYGKHQKQADSLKIIYYKLEKLIQQKQQLTGTGEAAAYQIELLEYQINEIEGLDLKENELDRLHLEHDQLAHAENTLNACQQALSALDADADGNVLSLLNQAKKSLISLFGKYQDLDNVKECLDNAAIQVDETITELTRFIEHLEINPDKLTEITLRLDKIHQIARKHKIEAEEIQEHHLKLKTKLESLINQHQSKAEIDAEIQLLEKQYMQLAQRLHHKRCQTAELLSKEITDQIQDLAMQGAQFTVQCTYQPDQPFSPHGLDEVAFCISANAGHQPKPIHKVASGGELSRISLALELVTLKEQTAPALIFDEVDVGIGGKTGAIVGQYLHQLSQQQQVICITHLPQVAAFGDHHFVVSKMQQAEAGQTQTQIHSLSQKDRIDEIARMLGGIDISAQARAQAKHLLKKQGLETAG